MIRTVITTFLFLAVAGAALGTPPPDDMVKSLSDTIVTSQDGKRKDSSPVQNRLETFSRFNDRLDLLS